LLVALAGLLVAGYRSRTEIDVARRLRIVRSRWWWRRREREEPLGEPRRVTLDVESRGGGKSRHTVYPVRLETDLSPHELAAPRDEIRARREAETIARCFSVPLADRRGGTELVRASDDLDRSVIDTARDVAHSEEAPAGCRVRRERTERGTLFVVRAPLVWLVPLAALPCLVPLAAVLAVWLPRVREYSTGATPLGWLQTTVVPVLVVCVPLVVLCTLVGRSGLLPRRVVAGGSALRIGRRVLPVHELEELHVTGSSGFSRHLRVATDRAIFRLGRGLREDELLWLRSALIAALKHG
jgi:hypothetical protein